MGNFYRPRPEHTKGGFTMQEKLYEAIETLINQTSAIEYLSKSLREEEEKNACNPEAALKARGLAVILYNHTEELYKLLDSLERIKIADGKKVAA
jgi:hypothetical protein